MHTEYNVLKIIILIKESFINPHHIKTLMYPHKEYSFQQILFGFYNYVSRLIIQEVPRFKAKHIVLSYNM